MCRAPVRPETVQLEMVPWKKCNFFLPPEINGAQKDSLGCMCVGKEGGTF